MAASTGDKITDVRNAARPNSARVSSGRSAGGTTLACDNLAGWPTASKVHFVTYTIDSNSDPVAGTQLDCTGIVSGNNIGSFTVIDGTDTGNSVNDVVEMLPTAAWGQDLADALTSQHTRTGAHKSITNTGGLITDTLTVSGAATLSGGTTLPAGDIATADIANAAVTADKLATGASKSTVTTSEATTSSTYGPLSTAQAVTVTVGANGLALVVVAATISLASVNAKGRMSFVLSGANTLAAADANSIAYQAYANGSVGYGSFTKLLTGLTPGSTIFTANFKSDDNVTSATFSNRELTVIPL